MKETCTLVWLRQDLRTADNPALRAAVDRGGPVVPAFVWAPQEAGRWSLGAASRWWLHQSLRSLSEELERAGSPLVIRRGESLEQLRALVRETGATAVYWNRSYEPSAIERDRRVERELRDDGLLTESFNGRLLFEPWEIGTGAGEPYRVFTPFWNACLAGPQPRSLVRRPARLSAPARPPAGLDLDALELLPKIDWAAGLAERWRPGARGAQQALSRFLDDALAGYAEARNRPDIAGTSSLSAHLAFGEISPHQVWHAVTQQANTMHRSEAGRSATVFLSELGWREFGYHLLFHFPSTTEQPLDGRFAEFPWRNDRAVLRRWQRGRTGYPIVDAGMRELWRTGWMHNRVRMIVASFLVKDLMIPWQQGAKWFWDCLVDADLASNTLGWQWTAGCGADAAPFFRVFNPVLQGRKFDPQGAYVRRFVPELAGLATRRVHAPWEADADELAQAGVRLGTHYPRPLIDHGLARRRALDAWERLRAGAATRTREAARSARRL